MSDDSSQNDGFVVRSRPDAGLVLEERPLTEQEKRDLDVGEFFSRGKTTPLLGAVVDRDATPDEATLLMTPPPSLWRAYAEGWVSTLPAVLAAAWLLASPSHMSAVAMGAAAVVATIPLRWWRTERREHAHRVEWARRNIARRRAQRELNRAGTACPQKDDDHDQ